MQQTPQQMFDMVHGFLAKAREALASGDVVDLSGVEGKVQELCDRVMHMPVGQAQVFRDQLATLAEDFTAFRQELETAQAEVKGAVDGLNLREKAAKAYRRSDAIAPTPSEPKKDE